MKGLDRYRAILGVQEDATWEDVTQAYYVRLAGLASCPEGVREQRLEELRRAYRALKRCRPAEPSASPRSFRDAHSVLTRSAAGALVLGFLLLGLALFHLATIRAMWTQFRPGDVLVRQGTGTLFGVVTAYDPAHAFTGGRAAAYQVRLPGSRRSVWISRRVLVRAVRVAPPGSSTESARLAELGPTGGDGGGAPPTP